MTAVRPGARSTDAPMRVLHLTKFYPPVHGGIESVTFELTEGLNRRGIPTDVLCAHTTGSTAVERFPAGYTVVRAASMGMLLSTSIAPDLIPELTRRVGAYDLLHVHLPDPMAALAVRVVRPGARLVLHWHSDVIRQRRTMRLYEPLQRWLLERADRIIATSPPYAEASPWLAPFRDKVRIIPLGIRDLPDEEADPTPAVPEDARVVFALGRMSGYKGFDMLIEAAADLPEDVQVVIGGTGPELAPYRGLVAERGLSGRVHLPGRLTDDQVHAWMRRADVFCLPSVTRAEAFGVVLLEAMALGTPIVTTELEGSGVPWVAPHGVTGLNVAPGRPDRLAEAITAVLQDPAGARRWGEGGRERWREHFTADTMVSETLELYREIL